MEQYKFTAEEIKETLKNWPAIVGKYSKANTGKAVLQIITSFGPFIALWVAMYYSLRVSYWLTLALAFINAFFLVRIFIIQHDCGHRSFFKNQTLNHIVGYVSSFFSTIPYKYWARVHDFHHAHCGQLETRDIGDINTLTAEEFKALSPMGRFKYRVYRLPVVTFLIAPIHYMLVNNRFPLVRFKSWKGIRTSQTINNLAIVGVILFFGWLIGWKVFFLVQTPIVVFFFIVAIWFFYVQHQHEHNYKEWKADWEYLMAAIKGSSFYKLPRLVHWLTGNIGYHHIHHLSSGIPSYNLVRCSKENPVLNQFVTKVTFWESLSYMRHKLWDEKEQRMISFKEFYQREKRQQVAA
ncbi:MAG TPA: fatty acid desaturase [Bacteroidetes bacterium]|nr:fatty acid desaturase [Bacteroidota bacterium]